MVTEIRDGVFWLGLTGVNAYLVNGDGLTLVDAGTPFDAGAVESGIETAGFEMADLERLLVTHYDVDHVGSITKLPTDAPVYVGRGDAAFLTGARAPLVSGHKSLTQRLLRPFVPRVDADRVRSVDDGDGIAGFEAYHTPGHTPGHTVYVHEERDAAFLGDLVVERDGVFDPSPWLLSYDTDLVAESIRTFVERTPPFEAAGVGHGAPVATGGFERLRRCATNL